MIDKADFTQIGKILKTHSLSGECASSLSVELDDIDTERMFLFLDIDDCLVPFRVNSYRYKTLDNVFISFVGIDTKDDASKIVAKTIWLENKLLPEDFEENNDILALVGFNLYDNKSLKIVGKVIKIDFSTINTIAEIETSGSNDTVLIPLAEELISSLDINKKIIYYDTPEGLL